MMEVPAEGPWKSRENTGSLREGGCPGENGRVSGRPEGTPGQSCWTLAGTVRRGRGISALQQYWERRSLCCGPAEAWRGGPSSSLPGLPPRATFIPPLVALL